MRGFWNDEDGDERTAANLNHALQRMADRTVLKRFFFVCLGLNVLIWISVLLFPRDVHGAFRSVHDASNKLSSTVLGLIFGIGMFLAYTIFRLRFPDIEEQDFNADVMATFAYQSRSTRRWRVWLVSTAFGVVNLILLVGLDLWLTSR